MACSQLARAVAGSRLPRIHDTVPGAGAFRSRHDGTGPGCEMRCAGYRMRARDRSTRSGRCRHRPHGPNNTCSLPTTRSCTPRLFISPHRPPGPGLRAGQGQARRRCSLQEILPSDCPRDRDGENLSQVATPPTPPHPTVVGRAAGLAARTGTKSGAALARGPTGHLGRPSPCTSDATVHPPTQDTWSKRKAASVVMARHGCG